MDARFYNSTEIDIAQLANGLENIFLAQGYQVQQVGTGTDQMLVQLKKGGDFEAILGLQSALTLIIQRNNYGVLAMIGQQKWVDKAAVGAVGLIAAPVLWPLMLTAGAGAIRQASLGNQVLNMVDRLVQQQKPGVFAGPIPIQLMPQVQQWSQPMPGFASQQQAPYNTVPTYQPTPGYQPPAQPSVPTYQPPAQPTPTYDPPQKPSVPTYTPPAQPAPTYQPPAQPTPAYQPPPKPSVPTYTPPANPTYPPPKPAVQYTPPPQQPAAAKPKPEPYVPPTPQQPPVVPKPTITYQATNVPDATISSQVPPSPPVPVYTPPVNPQPLQSKKPAPAPAQPLQAKPLSQPGFDPNAVWGNLTFENGPTIQLKGSNAMVGRYDHDLGGVRPEVDLSSMEKSDTASRIHASLEHVGSTYTVTDLNSTNATKINGKRLEPDTPTPLNDGDKIQFGSIVSTFHKA